ncbi:MAG: ABC transporter substrate-binding protein [Pseudomonadota bacterium]
MKLPIKPLVAFLLVAMTFSQSATAQERVVSIGGDVTEIIYALGESDRLVAVDSTSLYPPDALARPKVGYVRQLSAEGVLSVEPDLIVISGAAGPEPVLVQIRETGVDMLEMETEYTIDSIFTKIERIAAVLDVEEKGLALKQKIAADWAEAESKIDALAMRPVVLFFSTVRDGTPTAAGTDTAAHAVIELIGGTNPFDQQIGYKPLSFESAVVADPDVILIMDHVLKRMGGLEKVASHPALALTSAAKNGMIIGVDAPPVMQFSPRTPGAVAKLAAEISAKLPAPENAPTDGE